MNQGGEPDGTPAPRCYRHPGRETWVSCTRCERPICPECLRPASVGFQCPQCVAEGAASVRAPRTTYGARVAARAGLLSYLLIGANVAVFVVVSASGLTQFTGAVATGTPAARTFDRLLMVPILVAAQHQYYRLLSAAFLHTGLLHLAMNMIALAVVGPTLEQAFGRWRFLTVYLLAALGGSVAVYLFGNEFTGVAGASGAIFGVFAATVLALLRVGMDVRWIVTVLAVNLALSFAPGISLLGHLGGFVVGGLAGAAVVYTPSGRSRTAVQVLAFGVLLVAMIGLVAYRTHVLLTTG